MESDVCACNSKFCAECVSPIGTAVADDIRSHKADLKYRFWLTFYRMVYRIKRTLRLSV
jgi:hypothetical protein